jgi:hypothetical protein
MALAAGVLSLQRLVRRRSDFSYPSMHIAAFMLMHAEQHAAAAAAAAEF